MWLLVVAPMIVCWGSIACHFQDTKSVLFNDRELCDTYGHKHYGSNDDDSWGCFSVKQKGD